MPIQPQSPGLSDRIWYGAGNIESARRVGELGMHLMSSTLILEATGEPLDVLQSRQIDAFRDVVAASRGTRESRASRCRDR